MTYEITEEDPITTRVVNHLTGTRTPRAAAAWRELNEWRLCLLSDAGPPKAITRHALLTLATHADCNLIAFPSVSTLTRETHLARRTLVNHLLIAEQDGWIIRAKRSHKQSRWLHTVYLLQIPRGAADAPRQVSKATRCTSRTDEVHQMHTKNTGKKVREEVYKRVRIEIKNAGGCR